MPHGTPAFVQNAVPFWCASVHFFAQIKHIHKRYAPASSSSSVVSIQQGKEQIRFVQKGVSGNRVWVGSVVLFLCAKQRHTADHWHCFPDSGFLTPSYVPSNRPALFTHLLLAGNSVLLLGDPPTSMDGKSDHTADHSHTQGMKIGVLFRAGHRREGHGAFFVVFFFSSASVKCTRRTTLDFCFFFLDCFFFVICGGDFLCVLGRDFFFCFGLLGMCLRVGARLEERSFIGIFSLLVLPRRKLSERMILHRNRKDRA
jgi:hypothetical protein